MTPAWGQMTTLDGTPVTHCTWEYPADAWVRVQGFYLLVAPDTPSAAYTVVQVIMPEQLQTTAKEPMLLAKTACPTFVLAKPGQYRLAMYALGKQGEVSTYSNDVLFRWDISSAPQPSSVPPPQTSTPPWVWPSTPPPWAPRPTYPTPTLPKPHTGDGFLSENCMWTGTCR